MPSALLLIPLILAIAAIGAASVLAKRVGLLVPSAFIATYVLGVGAVTLLNIGVFGFVDSKFAKHWVTAWLEIYWPLWTAFYAPVAISALLACWFSRPSARDATRLLGVYLLLIFIATQTTFMLDGGLYLVGAFVLLSAMFFSMAYWKRTANRAHDDPSVLHGSNI